MQTNRTRRTRFVSFLIEGARRYTLLISFLAVPILAGAQTTCLVRHLTIFDGNLVGIQASGTGRRLGEAGLHGRDSLRRDRVSDPASLPPKPSAD
jgi:hypothetical protein